MFHYAGRWQAERDTRRFVPCKHVGLRASVVFDSSLLSGHSSSIISVGFEVTETLRAFVRKLQASFM